MRVLSCIPTQHTRMADKLAWIDTTAAAHGPLDLFVTPQEYFGGVQQSVFATGERVCYDPSEITAPVLALSAKHDMAIATGAVVLCPELHVRRERIWILDHRHPGGIVGHADKMMLPAYDHVDAKSPIGITPEYDLAARSQAFTVRGARVGILFCWEVHSNYLWHALCRAQPDLVLSLIKFGINGYPQKGHDAQGGAVVAGFGFGNDGGWRERLQMAARHDLACPIVCSTNSWGLPNKAGALAGTLLPFEEAGTKTGSTKARGSSLVQTSGPGTIAETVVVDTIDPLYWRCLREHKFVLHEATGEWPSSEARAYTMGWKIKRMERAFVGLPTLTAPPPSVTKHKVKVAAALAKGRRPR